MSQTIVYGCDWCDEIIPKGTDEKPKFAAKVMVEDVWPYPPMGTEPKRYEICQTCRKALKALVEGKYKR